jgi:hypothetical protein
MSCPKSYYISSGSVKGLFKQVTSSRWETDPAGGYFWRIEVVVGGFSPNPVWYNIRRYEAGTSNFTSFYTTHPDGATTGTLDCPHTYRNEWTTTASGVEPLPMFIQEPFILPGDGGWPNVGASASHGVRYLLLLRADFEDGLLAAHSGTGKFTPTGTGVEALDGVEFDGVGLFAGISSYAEDIRMGPRGMRFSLTGVPSGMIGMALGEEYHNRPVRLWLVVLDDAAKISGGPALLFAGRMDVMDHEDRGDTADLTLHAENRLVDARRASNWRYTDQHQRRLNDGDRSLEFVDRLQNKEIYWGRPTPGSK